MKKFMWILCDFISEFSANFPIHRNWQILGRKSNVIKHKNNGKIIICTLHNFISKCFAAFQTHGNYTNIGVTQKMQC